MKKIKAKLESELFYPLKDYFEEIGYEVHGEVNSCDIIAIKDSEIIALELKLKFTLKLVYQCLERKKITNIVYAAVETPKGGLFSKDSKRMINLLKRLEIGLFFISFYESGVKLDKILDPVLIPVRKNARKKALLLKEINDRSGSYNIGGSRGAHMSAFKEASIHVAVILSLKGELSAKDIKEFGGPEKSSTILIQNYYGWFARIRRGVYVLEPKGASFIQQQSDISEFYFNKYKESL
ncbi:MAG: DUF2161 family putative PD-(D/E)XK-type phosphodiesterase [Acidaminobacteraceae bacterium]